MGKSTHLAIDELAQAQSQAFQTVNDGIAALEQSINKLYTIVDDVDHDVTVSELNFIRQGVFKIGSSVTAVRFPATVNALATERVIDVLNKAGGNVTLRTTGTGTTVTISNNAGKRILVAGVDIIDLSV